jgi:signal transduction histidine kinase
LKLNFVAIASHELRTPTTSVYGALATLIARPELPADVRDELLRTAYEQSDRLRRLLEQLLDLSRLDADAMAVAPRPLVLRSALGEIVESAVGGEQSVELDVSPDLAAAVDPLVLDRVVSNLLVNAVRHGEPPIRLSAKQTDRYIHVAVEDAGAGVPNELRSRLFERFAHGDEGRGSGLGLAIARIYAQAHGGDLVYKPDERGARFELIVPQG